MRRSIGVFDGKPVLRPRELHHEHVKPCDLIPARHGGRLYRSVDASVNENGALVEEHDPGPVAESLIRGPLSARGVLLAEDADLVGDLQRARSDGSGPHAFPAALLPRSRTLIDRVARAVGA